ncbi:MAG: hypothetical protein ACM336_00440 [Acidobacteriota bacterium]
MRNRREFLKGVGLGAVTALTLQGVQAKRILIATENGGSFRRKLAEHELLRGLRLIAPQADVRLASAAAPGAVFFALEIDAAKFSNPEAYSIAAASADRLTFTGASEQALLYSVFDFLERQGAWFGIDGPTYPLEPAASLVLPSTDSPWTAQPRFAVRGLLPWPDFLNCISVYNEEDFRAYFEAMLRMRFNTFGMHVYTKRDYWAESYLSFEFAGAGHTAFLDNTASARWGYLPERTSRFTMGGAQLYDSEVFGSDSTRLARDPWEAAERARALLKAGFAHAARLGIRTGIGFEPYQIPDEILRALPPEARPAETAAGERFDIESVTARDLLETRLAQLLEAYPEVDYVWLWEDEGMNWKSRETGIPLSVTPFLQAHSFLKRHAPNKRMVFSGWGGAARNFEYFHKKLPEDIIFSCLGDSLGWDPTHEAFGKLEGRERWPIPWIEDDPAMWLPQFHVNRFERDLNLAEQYGCQGLLGIHWRHRIVEATAVYQSRFSWDKSLTPDAHYERFARAQAAGARSPKLARVLADADRNHKLLSTGTDEIENGHVVTREYSGDYTEGFTFWNKYEPSPELLASQKEVAAALDEIAAGAQSPAERERLQYLARHVGFLVPYADSWVLARRIQETLDAAAGLKKAGNVEGAREKVRTEAVPAWLKLAPNVRRAMLDYQSIVANRNELGQLASMHNKYVRLALYRLRLSMKEYLGELPPETESLFKEVTQPDAAAPARLFISTRPTLLGKGERVRLTIVAPSGPAPAAVTLRVRPRGGVWTSAPAKLVGRRTYEAVLGPFAPGPELADYYATAGTITAPAGAPGQFYTVTLT